MKTPPLGRAVRLVLLLVSLMMALVMATAQGPQVVSVIARFLGNGSTIRDASAASGSDACAKISAQAAAIGGFGQVSAQGFTSGSITCTSGTVNVPAGVEVVLGANSITASACPAFLLHSNSTLRGQSFNDGTLTNIGVANCPYNGIVSVAPGSTSVKIADLQTTGGGYYDSSGTAHGGGWQAGSIGVDLRGCSSLCSVDRVIPGAVETGISMTGYKNTVTHVYPFDTKYGVYCDTSYPGGSFLECNHNVIEIDWLTNTQFPVHLVGYNNIVKYADIETNDIPVTKTASFTQSSGVLTVTYAGHGLSNGQWVEFYSPSTSLDDVCQATVSSSSVVTCPAPAGSRNGSDMVIDPSIPWTFGGSSNAVYNQHTEGFGSIGFLGDLSGVAVTAVSTSGSTATFTGASAFPQYAYPATFGGVTAGGSGWTSADVNTTVTLACGATTVIESVSGGAVTAVAGSGWAAYGCTSGAGQAATGVHTGTGLTLNLTAIAAPTVAIYALPSDGVNNWDNSCNGVFTGTIIAPNQVTVPNSNCSTFTPNYTNQSSASFLSFQQPTGNYFKGGTPLNGIPVNTDGLKFYDWVLHDASGHVFGTPLTASKLEVCAPYGNTSNCPFWELRHGDNDGMALRNRADSAYGNLTVGNLFASTVTHGSGIRVFNLPPASANAGTTIYVIDSTPISAEGQICTGNGSTKALAFSNGSVWKCF